MVPAKKAREFYSCSFTPQIERGFHGCEPGKTIAYVPVLIAQVGGKPVTPFRIAAPGAGERHQSTPLLGIPAELRNNIDRLSLDVEVLRINLLKRESAKQNQGFLQFAAAHAVALTGAQHHVEFALRMRLQIEVVCGKNLQPFNAAFAGDQVPIDENT